MPSAFPTIVVVSEIDFICRCRGESAFVPSSFQPGDCWCLFACVWRCSTPVVPGFGLHLTRTQCSFGCVELEMPLVQVMTWETCFRAHGEVVAALGLQDELMNVPVKSGLTSSTQPEEKEDVCTNICAGKLVTFTRS